MDSVAMKISDLPFNQTIGLHCHTQTTQKSGADCADSGVLQKPCHRHCEYLLFELSGISG